MKLEVGVFSPLVWFYTGGSACSVPTKHLLSLCGLVSLLAQADVHRKLHV